MEPDALDPLEQEIAAKNAAVAAMERELELARIELRALQRAASLRPVPQVAAREAAVAGKQPSIDDIEPRRSSGKGKVAGTINRQWRDVMRFAVEQAGNEPLPPEHWSIMARECGYNISQKSARDWLRRGVGAREKYIERHGDAYKVSQIAIDKFGFVMPSASAKPAIPRLPGAPLDASAASPDWLKPVERYLEEQKT